jgi:hypothetical protein
VSAAQALANDNVKAALAKHNCLRVDFTVNSRLVVDLRKIPVDWVYALTQIKRLRRGRAVFQRVSVHMLRVRRLAQRI